MIDQKDLPKPHPFFVLMAYFGILLFVLSSLLLVFGQIPERYQLISRLQKEGISTLAEVYAIDKDHISFSFRDQRQKESYGYLLKKHYRPSQLASIRKGVRLRVRYLPSPPGGAVILLEEGLDRLIYDLYFFRILLITLFVSWLFVIMYPDFLFVGIEEELHKMELSH
ncbi:MAG: hypothetical protein AAFU64_13600 [Bacteroidota bacterium]